jgi:hypothetical protein
MTGVAEIGVVEFGVDPDEISTGGDTLLQKLLRGEEPEYIVFVRIGHRAISAAGPDLDEDEGIGTLAFGEASNELAGAGSDQAMLLSDGDWVGRPDDFGAANLEADPRVISAGDYQERVPLMPEERRRASQLIASVELANDDGFFSDWQFDQTVEGQPAKLFLGSENGLSTDWIDLAIAQGKSLRAGVKTAQLTLETIADGLDRSKVCQEKWAGIGGSTGGPELKDRRIQIVFGDAKNVEMILEHEALEIWRASAGEIRSFKKVKDALAPLSWTGEDFTDWNGLAQAVIPAGFYATATAIGRCRTNRGGLALGKVTADIEGSTLLGGYSARTGDILVWAARGPAGLPPSLVATQSYGVLPGDPISYVAFGEETVADLHNDLLRPFNGWYGPDQFGRLQVDIVNASLLTAPNYSVFSEDIFDINPNEFDQPPRWAQSISWDRNWTVMAASEIVDFNQNPNVSAEDAAFAQRKEAFWRETDTTVLQRYRLGGAIDGDDAFGPVAGFFTTEAGVKNAAGLMLAWLKTRKKRISARSYFNLLFARAGRPGSVQFDGAGLDAGRVMIAEDRTILSRDRQIEVNGLIALP